MLVALLVIGGIFVVLVAFGVGELCLLVSTKRTILAEQRRNRELQEQRLLQTSEATFAAEKLAAYAASGTTIEIVPLPAVRIEPPAPPDPALVRKSWEELEETALDRLLYAACT